MGKNEEERIGVLIFFLKNSIGFSIITIINIAFHTFSMLDLSVQETPLPSRSVHMIIRIVYASYLIISAKVEGLTMYLAIKI